jgi:hypothetical protein
MRVVSAAHVVEDAPAEKRFDGMHCQADPFVRRAVSALTGRAGPVFQCLRTAVRSARGFHRRARPGPFAMHHVRAAGDGRDIRRRCF